MIKSKKGITLIALIITIIILLILAGITIALLTGENGILKRAATAREINDISKYKEKIDMAVTQGNGDAYLDREKYSTKQEILKNVKSILEEDDDFKNRIKEDYNDSQNPKLIVTTKEGYVFNVFTDKTEYIGKDSEIEKELDIDLEDKNNAIIKFTQSTNEWTKNNVEVEISIGNDKYKDYNILYSLDTVEWKNYKEKIVVENNNTIIYAKLQKDNAVTKTMATHEVKNIDKVKPELEMTLYKSLIHFKLKDDLSGLQYLWVMECDLNSSAGAANKLNKVAELEESLSLKENTRYEIRVEDVVGNTTTKFITTSSTDGTEYEISDSEWEYKIDSENSQIILNKYKGSNKDVYVHAAYKVDNIIYKTKINSNSAFKNNTTIRNVNLDKNTYFYWNEMDNAFAGCTSLESVKNIPENVKTMNYTFAGCRSLKTAPQIPESVRSLNSTFYGAISLEGTLCINSVNVTNTENIVTAGYYQQYKKNFTIIVNGEDSDTYKSFSSWFDSNYYTYVKIVTAKIGDVNAIEEINSNEWAYTVDSNNVNLTEYKGNSEIVTVANKYKVNGRIYNTYLKMKSSKGFRENTAIKGINIGSEVRVEENSFASMFYRCTSLESVYSLPKYVENMTAAFSDCTSLKNIYCELPSEVTKMDYAFDKCSALSKPPVIPQNVTTMNYAFDKCTSLNEFPIIPKNVTTMNYIFYGCTSLSGILTVNSSNISSCDSMLDLSYCVNNKMNIVINTPGTSTTTYQTIKNWGSNCPILTVN